METSRIEEALARIRLDIPAVAKNAAIHSLLSMAIAKLKSGILLLRVRRSDEGLIIMQFSEAKFLILLIRETMDDHLSSGELTKIDNLSKEIDQYLKEVGITIV